MDINKKIIKNFKEYDKFLSTLNARDKEISLSLKMMYSIHMENNNLSNHLLDTAKQISRFFLKFFSIPFLKVVLKVDMAKDGTGIMENTKIEEFVSEKSNISLLSLKYKLNFNLKLFFIYKELFKVLYLLFKTKNLNKKYLCLLSHRLIDYLIVYHTIEVNGIKAIFIENDRNPKNLGLIHKSKKKSLKTIKYDNWLIDPINHNDVYCEYYFYPSIYHKNIVKKFENNSEVKYIKGGFLAWDKLIKYQESTQKDYKQVIYFTQFGIEKLKHIQYVNDIAEALEQLGDRYIIHIKVHPREDIYEYEKLYSSKKHVKVLFGTEDIYELISKSNFCFSIFSTISIEAKHLIENSFFINYDYQEFQILDYDKLKLDVVKTKEDLRDIFSGRYQVISSSEFIKDNNCSYPYTLKKFQEIIFHDE